MVPNGSPASIAAVMLSVVIGALEPTVAAAQVYSTYRTAIPTTTFATGLNGFVASGYAANGDRGAGCAYVRDSSSGLYAIQDAGGNWWQLASDKAVSVACFGATGNGTTDDTSSINNGINAGPEIYLPCGTYSVSSLILQSSPSPAPQVQRIIRGAGDCTLIKQNSSSLGQHILQLGSGYLNQVGAILVENLAFAAAGKKTAGAAIYAKGAYATRYRDLYAFDGNLYDGIDIDGVDFDHISNVRIYAAQHDGVAAWDGFDCGSHAPVLMPVTATTPAGGTTLTLASTSGVYTGMIAYQATVPNLSPIGTISAVSGTTITLSAGAPQQVDAGWYVTFGNSCSGTGLTLDEDTTITNSGNNNVAIYGGLGGVNVNSAHLYNAANYGLYIGRDNSSGQSNREIFLNAGTDIDSNSKQGLYVNTNSITRLIGTGQWINASASGGAVFVSSQLPNSNPPEFGAIVQFVGGNVGYSTGYGIHWADGGTLELDSVNISYNSGNGVEIAGTGDVIVSNNSIRRNGGYGVQLTGSVSGLSAIGNSWGLNTSGAQSGITASLTEVCQINRGGSASGC